MLQNDPRPTPDLKGPVPGEPARHTDAAADLTQGLRITRRYTRAETHPYDELEWELRDAVITTERGEVTFEQRNV